MLARKTIALSISGRSLAVVAIPQPRRRPGGARWFYQIRKLRLEIARADVNLPFAQADWVLSRGWKVV